MRAFLLAALIALAAIAPADAARRARHFGLPVLVQGPGWGAAETPQPPTQGLPGAPGYGDNAIAVWDSVSYALLTAPTPICAFAYHNSGISSVVMSVDNGPWINAPYTTAGASPGVGEYCAMLTPSTMSDGQHEIRAIITPNTGIPRVLQSGATVAVTSGNPYIPHAAHGQIYNSTNKAIVVTGGASAGFAANTAYYLARGGLDSHGYMLSDTATPSSMVFNGTTYGAAWNIIQTPAYPHAAGYLAGTAITIQHQGGRAAPTSTQLAAVPFYYVCASGLAATNFKLSNTYADAIGSCTYANSNPFSQLSSAAGTFYAQPVVVPSASDAMNFDFLNKGKLETALGAGESLYVQTNAQGHASYQTLYVDTSGSNSNAGTSSTAPLADLYTAFNTLESGSYTNITSTAPALSTNSTGCVVFTRGSHGYAAGKPLTISGTLGTSFQPTPGSIDLSQQVYYVAGNTDLTANTFALSLQPGGACVAWAVGDTGSSYSATAIPDIGGSTIYLMCDAPCSTPAQYPLTYSGTGSAKQTYVNILPAPGLTAANVAITNSSGGKAAEKLHVAVNLTSPSISLTTTADSPYNGATFSFATGSLPSWLVTGSNASLLASDNGGECASVGSSGNPTTVTAFNNSTSPATVTVSTPNFADCPAGTVITFTNEVTLYAVNNATWVDSVTATGPGDTIANQHIAGGQAADYYTNVTASGFSFPFYTGTLNRNITLAGGAQAFDSPLALANITVTNLGDAAGWFPVTTCPDGTTVIANCPAQAGALTKLYFQGGSLPSNMQTGWIIGVGSASNCNSGITYITGFHLGNVSTGDPDWITVNPATPTSCTVNLQLVIGPGTHNDFIYQLAAGDNNIAVNVACIQCNAEGVFQQSGQYWDLAVVNSKFLMMNTSNTALGLQSPLTNAYFYGNILNGPVSMDNVDYNFAGTDVVFSNNTCTSNNGVTYTGQVNGLGVANVTIIGGNC